MLVENTETIEPTESEDVTPLGVDDLIEDLRADLEATAAADLAADYDSYERHYMPYPPALLEDIFVYADIFEVYEDPRTFDVAISIWHRRTHVDATFTGRNLDEATELALDWCMEQEWLLDDILETHDLSFTDLRMLVEGEVEKDPTIVVPPHRLELLAVAGQPFTVRTLAGDFLVTPVVDALPDDLDDELGHVHFDADWAQDDEDDEERLLDF